MENNQVPKSNLIILASGAKDNFAPSEYLISRHIRNLFNTFGEAHVREVIGTLFSITSAEIQEMDDLISKALNE